MAKNQTISGKNSLLKIAAILKIIIINKLKN